MSFRRTVFGAPLAGRGMPSGVTVVSSSLAEGYTVAASPLVLPPSSTDTCANLQLRDGVVVPREGLKIPQDTASAHSIPSTFSRIVGGAYSHHSNSDGAELIVWGAADGWPSPSTGSSAPLVLQNAAWSALSRVSSGGSDDAPTPFLNHVTGTAVYSPRDDRNIVIFGGSVTPAGGVGNNPQRLYYWVMSQTTYSQLTQAPAAKYVASLDNYVFAFSASNPTDGSVPTRIYWSDRGDPYKWELLGDSLAGFEDLAGMQGIPNGCFTQDDRVILTSTLEVWIGRQNLYPRTWEFLPLERQAGMQNPRAGAITPAGFIFFGTDRRVYLLPRNGGAVEPISGAVDKELAQQTADAIVSYNEPMNAVDVWFPGASSTYGLRLDLRSRGWYPVTLPFVLDNAFYAASEGVGITGFGPQSFGGVYGRPIYTSNRTVYAGSRSVGTTDAGTTFTRRWRTPSLLAGAPERTGTVTSVRLDYESVLTSHVTLRVYDGNTVRQESVITLPATSAVSGVRWDAYVHARDPRVEVLSSGTTHGWHRLATTIRLDGRPTP